MSWMQQHGKRNVKEKGKAGHGQKWGKRNRMCLPLRLQSVFLMSCFKRVSSGTNATKSSPCVCRNMVLRKVAWHPVSQAERRQTGPSVFQCKQISPAHLFFSHSHTLGVLRAPLRPTYKGSCTITVLSYIAHGGKSAVGWWFYFSWGFQISEI